MEAITAARPTAARAATQLCPAAALASLETGLAHGIQAGLTTQVATPGKIHGGKLHLRWLKRNGFHQAGPQGRVGAEYSGSLT